MNRIIIEYQTKYSRITGGKEDGTGLSIVPTIQQPEASSGLWTERWFQLFNLSVSKLRAHSL